MESSIKIESLLLLFFRLNINRSIFSSSLFQSIPASAKAQQLSNGSLLILGTELEDAGIYTCIAFNDAGSVSIAVAGGNDATVTFFPVLAFVMYFISRF